MTANGIFMGTTAERTSLEQGFALTFSNDPDLWKENDFSTLSGSKARYYTVTKCDVEELDKAWVETSATAIEYGQFSYPEYFVPRGAFDPSNPTGGMAPHHVWFVRGFVDRKTRVCEQVLADGSPPVFFLVTLLDQVERERGVEARLKYRNAAGDVEFIVTVAPLE